MLLRSLGFLVQRVQHDKADKILDTLCTRLVSGKKEADRESASISLKTTILDLPADTAKAILRHIVPKLLKGTQTQVTCICIHLLRSGCTLETLAAIFGHASCSQDLVLTSFSLCMLHSCLYDAMYSKKVSST